MPTDAQFADLDRQIERVLESLDGCRQAILLSRAGLWIGMAVIVAIFTVASGYRTAPILFTAITAVIAGTVWAGANKATRSELDAKLADLEARKARLFDEVAADNGWRDLTPTVH